MKKLFAAVAVMGLVVPLFAADKEVEDLLSNMRKAYSGAKSAKLNVSIETGAGDGKVTIKMILIYAQTNKVNAKLSFEGVDISWEVRSDGKHVSMTRGQQTMSEERSYSVDNLGEFLQPGNLESISFFDWKRQLSTSEGANMAASKLKVLKNQKWNGKSWTVLDEVAPEMNVHVIYYIDPKSNLIWRTIVKRIEGDSTFIDAKVTSLTINPKVDESKFKVG